MFSYENLKEAIIHGLMAVRGVILALFAKCEDLNLAARNIKQQARIAAHYAMAHLDQGGPSPKPMSREAKENVIRLVLARVEQTPRSLKSLPGGAAIVSLDAMVPEAEGPGLKLTGELDELADAVGSIVRGALLCRDCIRKNRLFHAAGQRSTETTSIETTKRWA